MRLTVLLPSCSSLPLLRRNLTRSCWPSADQGRAEARALGEHVKRLKIPIGEVLASPFCRTMETARLAFGKARAINDVRGGPLAPDEGGESFTVVGRLRRDEGQ